MAEVIRYDDERAEGSVRRVLEGAPFVFTFKWNTRDEYWSASVYDEGGAALVVGLRLALGVNLFRPFSGSFFPGGALVVVDTTGRDVEPDRDSLRNGRTQVVYVTAAEVAAEMDRRAALTFVAPQEQL